MFREYFNIIRKALSEGREKKAGTYYEFHHIVPKSFGKKSSLVLLTAEEHYTCYKILATNFRHHPIYGKKMLWAFHRLSYDGKRTISAEEYAEGRKLLMPIWSKKFSDEHRKKISEKQKGNTNNKSRVFKGMKSDITEEGRAKLAAVRRELQTGRVGIDANASKGVVVYEKLDGTKIEAGSAFLLASMLNISQSSMSYRIRLKHNTFTSGWKVYYKESL